MQLFSKTTYDRGSKSVDEAGFVCEFHVIHLLLEGPKIHKAETSDWA
jgi:hypothetical protein